MGVSELEVEVEYGRLAPELVRYASVLVGPHDAADVVADAVVSTLERGSLASVVDLRAYWFRAVTNTAVSLHRSSSRRVRREELAAARVPRASLPAVAEDPRRILETLSAQQRAVIYLTYWHDYSPVQVAEVIGVSEGAVRRQLARARARLREVLGDG